MTEASSKAEIGQVVVTDLEDHLTEVDHIMDKTSEEKTSKEEISEEEEIISEGEMEEISGKIADLTGIAADQGIDSFQDILLKMTEVG